VKKRRLWILAFALAAMLIAASCAHSASGPIVSSSDSPELKILPPTGPWSIAEIDGSLGEAFRLYAKAGGLRGDVRAQFVAEIREELRNLGAGVASGSAVSEKITYVTQYACENGSRKTWELSGIVFLPIRSAEGKLSAPIVSIQHGTQVNRNNAPSRFEPNPHTALRNPLRPEADEALLNYLECSMGASLAASGYIVVMPDYPGFGDNADIHPYVHGSLGDCVRDAILQTIELTKADRWKDRLSWNGRLYLTGYSEGGYATMVGAKSLASMTVGKIPVTAAIPCDGAYDLSGTMTTRILARKAEFNPHYIPFTFMSYNAIYGDSIFRSSSPFKERYAARIPRLFDGNHWTFQMSAVIPRAGLFSHRYVACDVLDSETIEDLGDPSSMVFKAIRENDAFRGWKPDFPMRIVHCEKDDVVPVENAIVAYRAFGGPEAANVELIYVEPVDFAAGSADIHTRAFSTAMFDGFSYITRIESMLAKSDQP